MKTSNKRACPLLSATAIFAHEGIAVRLNSFDDMHGPVACLDNVFTGTC